MKKIYATILSVMMTMTLIAAETTYLPISVMAGDNIDNLPSGAKTLIENKLTQVLTRNGIAGMNYSDQFVLTVVATPIDKDVVAGPPTKIAEKMDMTLYIVDAYAKKVFSSTSMMVRGLGETETRCYLNAISRMPVQSPQLSQFIDEGKRKIIDYYDHEAPQFIKKAQYIAQQKNYEEALSIIALIPQQCKYYDASLKAGLEIYQMYLDNECNKNLVAARQAWAAEQNSSGAYAAGEYLANILPDAGCYDEAMELYREIKGKVLDDWKFEMKQYQDGVDLESQRISAMRDVGVAYGNNQPRENTKIEFIRGIL